jgi:anti-sigma-K factor RskA
MENHVLDLLPGFALDILDQKETEDVLEHLSGCKLCHAELASYQVVTQSLGLAAPLSEPPPGLKEKVLGGMSKNIKSRSDGLTKRDIFTSRSLKSLLFTWRPLVALLVLALFASNLLLWRQVVQLRAAPAQTNFGLVNLVGTGTYAEASGILVVSPDGRDGTLVVTDLKQLDADHQYQLWLIKDDQRTSGGVFNVSKEGYGSLWVNSDKPLVSFPQFGITIEPRGGSPGPTGAKVLGGQF